MFSSFSAGIIAKLTAFFMSFVMFLCPGVNYPEIEVDVSDDITNYQYVFVHGLNGWGEYAFYYDLMPYWGMFGGDMMKYLNARGYKCAAASVDPNASAWDRACELYAQLTGTRVDYGKEHSERCNHNRYGKDYTGKALIKSWSETDKINLLGHSFGGATVLMLLDLLKDGSEAERASTNPADLSELFTGGKEDMVYSITTLSAPLNGTTASEPKSESTASDGGNIIGSITSLLNMTGDDRDPKDTAHYDLTIDGAMELLENIEIVDNVYYFSQPCAVTTKDENGNWVYDKRDVEIFYRSGVDDIVNWTGYTEKGYYCDESWQENDGLVNTVSAKAPFDAPQKPFDRDNIVPGEYNVFETFYGDHMSLMGGFFIRTNIREYYPDLMDMINNIG